MTVRLILSAIILFATMQAHANCKIDVDRSNISNVSGQESSDTVWIKFGGDDAKYNAISEIKNWETWPGNKPCKTRVAYQDIACGDRTYKTKELCGGSNDVVSVGQVYPYTGLYIGAIRICKNNDRLKGINIKMRSIKSDCSTLPEARERRGSFWTYMDEDDRANCGDNDWKAWRYCDAGSVATGLVLHKGDDGSITGVQLFCRPFEYYVGGKACD